MNQISSHLHQSFLHSFAVTHILSFRQLRWSPEDEAHEGKYQIDLRGSFHRVGCECFSCWLMQNLIHQGLVIACEVECDNPQTLGTRLCRGHNAVAHLTHLNWAFPCQFKSTFCILVCTRCTKPAVPSKFRAAAASMMYLPEPSSSSQPLWRRIKNNERIENHWILFNKNQVRLRAVASWRGSNPCYHALQPLV
jgi:hypothetical protein